MALAQEITCDTCKKRKTVMVNPSALRDPTTCDECDKSKARTAKQKHLAHLATLTVEERLAKIEEFIYDHRHSYHPRKPWRA